MSVAASFRGESLDEALSSACAELKARLGELHYEVVSEDAGAGVEIRAEVDPVAVLGLFLSEAFHASGLELRARIRSGEEALLGELSGDDLGLLLGGEGKGLDALQYLCNRILNRRLREHHPVSLDAQDFKRRRAERLRQRAEVTAERVRRDGAPVTLGPMTPAARRDVHLALADDPLVETVSDGEGFFKRVVVRRRDRR